MTHQVRRALNAPNGFSLVELIVYFAIFAVAGTVALSVFSYALRGKVAIRQLTEVHLNSERMMEQIVDRVRTAQTIYDASSTLNLTMANGAQNPTIISLVSGAITIKEGNGAAAAILSTSTVWVSALSFTEVTNPDPSTSSVKISFTAGFNQGNAISPGTDYTLQTVAMPLH